MRAREGGSVRIGGAADVNAAWAHRIKTKGGRINTANPGAPTLLTGCPAVGVPGRCRGRGWGGGDQREWGWSR